MFPGIPLVITGADVPNNTYSYILLGIYKHFDGSQCDFCY